MNVEIDAKDLLIAQYSQNTGLIERGLLPPVRTEADFQEYEDSVEQLLATIQEEFPYFVDQLMPGDFDLWSFANYLVQEFRQYQNVPFKRLDVQFIRQERRVCCAATAYILAQKWRRAQEGNSAVYFIQNQTEANSYQEPGTKKSKDPSQAHVVVALLPPEISSASIYDEYEKFLENPTTTPVQFVHYDYRLMGDVRYSVIEPFQPTNWDLRSFIRKDDDGEFLRHRIRVYYSRNEQSNAGIYAAAFGKVRTVREVLLGSGDNNA